MEKTEPKNKELYRFEKNKLESIVFMLSEYNGKNICHLRTFVKDTQGNELPTKKGLTFAPEYIDHFLKGTTALADAVEAHKGQ